MFAAQAFQESPAYSPATKFFFASIAAGLPTDVDNWGGYQNEKFNKVG